MFTEKKLNLFFDDKKSYVILFLTCLIFIIFSKINYSFEVELSKQDAAAYILVAQDLGNYFKVEHQEAIRIFPSLLVNIFSKITNLDIEKSFQILVYFSFFILIFKVFLFLKKIGIKNYISLSIIASSVFSTHSILYTIFNFYQFLDLLLYIFIIYFLELANENSKTKLFFVGVLAILTKEFLLVLVLASFINQYLLFKERKVFMYIFFIILIFFVNLMTVKHFNTYVNDIGPPNGVGTLIKSFFSTYNLFISSAFESLYIEKNIFLFFPFCLILFSKNFYITVKKYLFSIPYLIIPISFSIFLNHYVGNNFFRVFYQGYFILVLLALIYIAFTIKNNNKLQVLFFLSPLAFIVDYLYLFITINQHGFFNFFQFERYNFFSGYFIYNIIIILIISINLKKIYK